MAKPCPDALYGKHGPINGDGRCPWCGTKVEPARPVPDGIPRSQAAQAYDYYFDPDYGADRRDAYTP